MRCDRIREALSARIDGEDPGLPDGECDAHLGGCADCRAWQQRAYVLTRRVRLGCTLLDHDLSAAVLAAAAAAPASRQAQWSAVIAQQTPDIDTRAVSR